MPSHSPLAEPDMRISRHPALLNALGYFGYHAVPRNEYRLKAFRHEVLRMWWWQLRRRSQRSRWSWERFREKLGHLIPEVAIRHPYPEVRFASKHPNIQGKNRVR
jgi:hypothetical protein